MWELICYQTYKLPGIPVDLSDYDNHGQPESLNDDDFGSDGVTPGSGVVRFPRNGSRIRIPPGKAWRPMGAVAVEVIARRSAIATNQTLVSAHQSFLFKMIGPFLFFFLHGDPSSTDSIDEANSYNAINSSDHAFDLQPHPIPVGQWVKLAFVHDGLNTAQLFLDDQLIAVRTWSPGARVLPVGPLGVSIGNQADRDDRFFINGEIDEVKIWRIDPREPSRKFLSRPFNGDTADCWEKLSRRIREALDMDPKCEQVMLDEIVNQVKQVRFAIADRGPDAVARYIEFCEEYEDLWMAGRLDDPEMKQIFSAFCNWLRELGISLSGGSLHQMLQSSCLSEILNDSALLDCDPQVVAFIQLIANACPG